MIKWFNLITLPIHSLTRTIALSVLEWPVRWKCKFLCTSACLGSGTELNQAVCQKPQKGAKPRTKTLCGLQPGVWAQGIASRLEHKSYEATDCPRDPHNFTFLTISVPLPALVC